MAVRTVRVRLELDRTDYKQGLRDAAAETRDFDGEVKTLGESAERTGVELKDSGTSARKLGDDAKTSARDTDGLGESVKKTSKETTGLGDETKKSSRTVIEFSDSAKQAGNGLDQLKAHLEETRATYSKLKQEFVSSGNTSLLGDVKKAERDAQAIEGLIKKTFGDIREEVKGGNNNGGGLLSFALDEWAAGMAKSTANGIGTGLNAAGSALVDNPIISTILVAGAIIAAPIVASMIGTAVGAGVALGFGGGVIALGISRAIADARVRAAWSGLGAEASHALTDASGGFVQPMIDGAAKVKAAFIDIEPDIKGAFSTLAPTLNDLFDGAAGFTRAIGPGLKELANFSAPFIQDLAAYLPQLGDHLKEFIDKVTNAGPGVENFFNDLLDLSLNAIDALGDLVNWGSRVYDVFSALGFVVEGNLKAAGERIGDVFAKTAQSYGGFHNNTIDANAALGLLNGTMQKSADGSVILKSNYDRLGESVNSADFSKLSSQINATAQSTDALAGAISNRLLGAMLQGDQANLAFHQSLSAVTDAVRQNGHETDINTVKGQANHEMALRAVSSNVGIYNSMIQSGAGAQEAAAAYDKNTGALERQLRQAHFTQGQIDDLIGKYRNVPDSVNTDIELHGVAQAISDLNTTLRLIYGLPASRTVDIGVHTFYTYTGTPPGLAGNAIALHHQAKGGVTAYAAGGVDYKARSGILAPSDPGTILAGEPQTGGEVFTPKLGISDERGLALANVAAGWHGGHVVADGPRGGGGYQPVAFAPTYQITVTSAVGTTPAAQGQAIVSAIKAFERDNSAYWRGG